VESKQVMWRLSVLQAEDLKLLMSRLEHWAHRLFPKMSFDDFIERLEKLGSKKEIMASLIAVFTVYFSLLTAPGWMALQCRCIQSVNQRVLFACFMSVSK